MKSHRYNLTRRSAVAAALGFTLALQALVPTAALANRNIHASEASSALSMVPVALSVAAPVALLSAGAVLTVVAVEASAAGTVWLFERASDGAKLSVNLAANAAAGASLLAGGAVVVTALSTGWVLSQAGKALLIIPNEVGARLLHHERLGY